MSSLVNTEKESFACFENNCTKTYSRKAHLIRHLKTFHFRNDEKPASFTCHICFKCYQSKQSLKKHLLNTHLKEFTFRCMFCSKGFTKESHMMAHIHIHTGFKLFKCAYCEKTFRNQSEKGKHEKSHREYICKCGKKFITHSDYLKHKRIDHINDRYECDICHKVFFKKSSIYQHIKGHSADKIYFNCEICPRSYSFKKNLIQHIKLVHNRLTYDCEFPECGAKLSSKQRLQIHIKSKHSNEPVIPKLKSIKPRNKRRDAGSMVRSTAVKLSGVCLTLAMEKEIVKDSEKNDITKIGA